MEDNKKKIYVSSSWLHRGRVKLAISELVRHKFDVSYCWSDKPNTDKTAVAYSEFSEDMLNGIESADIFIFLHMGESINYYNSFFEIGYALSKGKEILIYNPTEKNILQSVPTDAESSVHYHNTKLNHFRTWSDMVTYLKTLN